MRARLILASHLGLMASALCGGAASVAACGGEEPIAVSWENEDSVARDASWEVSEAGAGVEPAVEEGGTDTGRVDAASAEDAGGVDGEDAPDAAAPGDAAPVDPSSAVADEFSTPEDVELAVVAPGVLANDVGGGAGVVPAVGRATEAGGVVTIGSDGSFVYRPPPDFSGVDRFEYELAAVGASPRSAQVTLQVAPVNDPPTLGAPVSLVLDTDPGAVTRTRWLPAWTPGPPDEVTQSVTFTIVAKSASTSLEFTTAPVVDVDTGDLSFAIRSGTFGTALFSLVARDDGGGADTTASEFAITVNSPPIAVDDDVTGDEGSNCIPVSPLANDVDPDGDALRAVLRSVPIHGKLYLFVDGLDPLGAFVGEDGVFSGRLCYRPNLRFFHGADSFTYVAEDGRGGVSEVRTVSLTVRDRP